MNTLKRQFLSELLRVFDILLCIGAFAAAMIVNASAQSLEHMSDLFTMRISIVNIIVFLSLVGSWHLIFTLLNFYNSRRLSSLNRDIIDIGKGTVFCSATVFLSNTLYPMGLYQNRFVFIFAGILFILLVTSRMLLRTFLSHLRKSGANLRYVLIIGTNPNALSLGQMIKKSPELGYKLNGYVDVQWMQTPSDEYKLVSDFEHFKAYIRHNVVDEIFICLPIQSFYGEITSIINTAVEQGILVRMRTEFFRTNNTNPKIEYLGHEMLLTYSTGHMRRRLLLIKKVFDFSLAMFLLILVSPILAAAALAIKITSRGPIFFIQERVGFNKRRFKLIKFRTMILDAEKKLPDLEHLNEVKGAAFKLKNDPRITPVGRILRKLSIDELPQLFNVLRGDMSLVGPRPLPERDFRGFNTDWHRRRFCVKPGMTCLWQVSGRNNLTFDEWMALDMKYIDTWSPLLDMKILLKTVPAVLSGDGAS